MKESTSLSFLPSFIAGRPLPVTTGSQVSFDWVTYQLDEAFEGSRDISIEVLW